MATRRPKFRRRRAALWRLLPALLVTAGALWGFGLLGFSLWVYNLTPPALLPYADGIVVLTGGDDRIGAALALLAAHDAPALLVSGTAPGTYLGDLTPDNAAAATRYAGEITLGHMAETTHENAAEIAAWARARHAHSLIVVTADYHMPRAMLEIRRALPQLRLTPDPVRPPAMAEPWQFSTIRLLALEYSKFLVVRAGLGGIAAQLLGAD
jgi:uncharacterized SAM-binding protein YcdF (DUF218 family)